MIDFTTIELNPIPLPIKELQMANSSLEKNNKVLNVIVWGVIGLGVAILTYNALKNYKNEEPKK